MLQEKLDFLLDKYSVNKSVQLKDKETAVIDGTEVPVLAHRSERRFIELKNIALGGTLSGISVIRVASIIEKGADIKKALYREFDLCQWILNEKIIAVTAMKNDNVINIIATTNSGIVCTLEISATLNSGVKPIDKHEIIAQHGTACDTVVDAQIKQESIYVFGDNEKKYTDVDFELYGLLPEDIAVVRAAFSLAAKNNMQEHISADENLKKLVEATEKSVNIGERVVLA